MDKKIFNWTRSFWVMSKVLPEDTIPTNVFFSFFLKLLFMFVEIDKNKCFY